MEEEEDGMPQGRSNRGEEERVKKRVSQDEEVQQYMGLLYGEQPTIKMWKYLSTQGFQILLNLDLVLASLAVLFLLDIAQMTLDFTFTCMYTRRPTTSKAQWGAAMAVGGYPGGY